MARKGTRSTPGEQEQGVLALMAGDILKDFATSVFTCPVSESPGAFLVPRGTASVFSLKGIGGPAPVQQGHRHGRGVALISRTAGSKLRDAICDSRGQGAICDSRGQVRLAARTARMLNKLAGTRRRLAARTSQARRLTYGARSSWIANPQTSGGGSSQADREHCSRVHMLVAARRLTH